MTDSISTEAYNYDVFHWTRFEPIMQWDRSPATGTTAPDFPLWHLDGTQTTLAELWAQHKFLIVEFGSFT